MSKKIKVTVNLLEDDVNALRALAEKRGTTQTESLRRAVATEKFLEDAVDGGAKVLLRDKDGTIREIVLR